MTVTIIGAGRLGGALALRMTGLGHDCRILHRSPPPDHLRDLPNLRWSPLALAAHHPADTLVLIAAPAQKDVAAEMEISDYLAKVPRQCLVASAAIYENAPHESWSAGRRYMRFLASPAISVPDHPALLVIDGDAQSCPELLEGLGPVTLAPGSGEAFLRHVQLLMGTVLHLAVLEHLAPEDQLERDLVASTLREASVLLSLTGQDPDAAIDLCATPGGLTRRLTSRLGEFLPILDMETSRDGHA